MKNNKTAIFLIVCLFLVVVSALAICGIKSVKPTTPSVEEESSTSDENEYTHLLHVENHDTRYVYKDMLLPVYITPESAEIMLEYNNYFAAKFGNFDVEYNSDLKDYSSGVLYDMTVEYFFDDSGVGIVQYIEHPGMHQKYGYVWRTTDYGKTWSINPEYETGLECHTIRSCKNNLFSTGVSPVTLGGWLLVSPDYGKSFNYWSPEDLLNQSFKGISSLAGVHINSQVEILSLNTEKEYLLVSITGYDYESGEYDYDKISHCFFIGKFNFNIELIETIYLDKDYLESIADKTY